MTTPATDGATTTAPEAQDLSTEFVLSDGQIAFYRTFGFLHLPGLFAAEIDAISAAFDEVFADLTDAMALPDNPFHKGRGDGGEPRLIIPAVIDKHPALASLRHDARVEGLAATLLECEPEYAESDGNLFNCDLTWHIDAYGSPIDQDHVKLFFYLDRLTRETGALRVLPGTHFLTGDYADGMRRDLFDPDAVPGIFGVGMDELPCWTLEVEPGDLIVGNFRTFHASFGGRPGRRLFTVNFRVPR